MKARDLMTSDVISLDVQATIGDAFAVLTEYEVRHLPIVAESGRVVGVLSDRDVRRVEGLIAQEVGHPDYAKNVLAAPVTSLVSGPPLTCAPDAPVDEVIDALVENRVGCVIVVDADDEVQGIVSTLDVLCAAKGRLD